MLFISFKFFPFAVRTQRRKKKVTKSRANRKKNRRRNHRRYLTLLFKVVHVKCSVEKYVISLILVLIGMKKQRLCCMMGYCMTNKQGKNKCTSSADIRQKIISRFEMIFVDIALSHDHRFLLFAVFFSLLAI